MEDGKGARQIRETLRDNRGAVEQLARSGEAKRLMELLGTQSETKRAAQAAAGGDVSELTAMLKRLMSSQEGKELVQRLAGQAKRSGLDP